MFIHYCTPAEALEGSVKLDVLENGAEYDSQGVLQPPMSASIEMSPPTWIKGKVFSNDDMLMYSFYQIAPFKKEWRWEIPPRQTTIKMRPGIVKHWKGYKPEGDCSVVCTPMGRGKFRFKSQRPDGPHGYLERIGQNPEGYPRYRFWFDDEKPDTADSKTTDAKPETSSPSEASKTDAPE